MHTSACASQSVWQQAALFAPQININKFRTLYLLLVSVTCCVSISPNSVFVFCADDEIVFFSPPSLAVPDDLTPEEQQELENIRRRKQELLEDIQVPELTPSSKMKFCLETYDFILEIQH